MISVLEENENKRPATDCNISGDKLVIASTHYFDRSDLILIVVTPIK